MRTVFAILAIVLGLVGVLICVAAIGTGWIAALKTLQRVDRVVDRVDQGLSESDDRLAQMEARITAARSELDSFRQEAERLVAENPELPQVEAAIERLLNRFVPVLHRLEATASSLRTVAAGVRAAADIVEQFDDDAKVSARARNGANTIDRAAETLHGPQAKIDQMKSAKAVWLTRDLIEMIRHAAAGSELLAKALAAARAEIATARKEMKELWHEIVVRVYLLAIANSVFWTWGGLGQLYLIGWGRRRLGSRGPVLT